MLPSAISKSTLKYHLTEYLKSLCDKKILYFVFRGSKIKSVEEGDSLPPDTLDAETPITKAILLSGSFNPLHDGHI